MALEHLRRSTSEPINKTTLCFLVSEDQILLGHKKTGFGRGKFIGIGGRQEPGETIEETAIREVLEEVKVRVTEMRAAGTTKSYYNHVPDGSNDTEIAIFVASEWSGEPQETDEIRPRWFPIDNLPYGRMWPDTKFWLPQVALGATVQAEFILDTYSTIEAKRVELT